MKPTSLLISESALEVSSKLFESYNNFLQSKVEIQRIEAFKETKMSEISSKHKENLELIKSKEKVYLTVIKLAESTYTKKIQSIQSSFSILINILNDEREFYQSRLVEFQNSFNSASTSKEKALYMRMISDTKKDLRKIRTNQLLLFDKLTFFLSNCNVTIDLTELNSLKGKYLDA